MQNQDVSLRNYPRLAPPPPDEGRLARYGYLIICLAIYGGSLGAASLLVNFLSRTKYPDIPEHMELAPTLLLSGGAFVVCAVLGGLIAYWFGQRDEPLRYIIKWLVIGFGFGVLSPIISGGTLPLTLILVEIEAGVLSVGEAPVRLVNALFHIPRFAFTHGVFGLFTGLLAGAPVLLRCIIHIGAARTSQGTSCQVRPLCTRGPAIHHLLRNLYARRRADTGQIRLTLSAHSFPRVSIYDLHATYPAISRMTLMAFSACHSPRA